MDIAKIDKNFKVETDIKRNGLSFYDVKIAPFALNGVFYENGLYRRLPENTAKAISDGTIALHANTAGGAVRFRSNSKRIAVSVKYRGIGRMGHFPLTGAAGLDIYYLYGNKWIYHKTFVPSFEVNDTLESEVFFADSAERELLINFPTYSEVAELLIGLEDSADLSAPSDYTFDKPIVFYGSSITQGGCTSRPGNAYTAIAARLLDCPHINLGFSGNAHGEKKMADYIAGLDMTAFVLDYDHNAPSSEHLRNTHESFFLTVREKHPLLPIVMMTRPKYHLNAADEEAERIKIITETYENALKRGDKNVALIKGYEMITENIAEYALVDDCHPNDCGFTAMAFKLTEVLKNML